MAAKNKKPHAESLYVLKDLKAPLLRRMTVSLPEELILQVDEALFNLRKTGQRISFSGFLEVAVKELLRTNNVAAAARRHGASARRHSQGSHKPSGRFDGKADPKVDGKSSGRIRP